MVEGIYRHIGAGTQIAAAAATRDRSADFDAAEELAKRMRACGIRGRMHRKPVLELLRAHAQQPLDAHEAATTAEMIRFVETHADCFLRSCAPGHLTGSAWILSPDRRRTLLTHHHKLDKWLQLGGHADGETDLAAVAMREAREESGLTRLRLVSAAPFDIDRHWIPPRRDEPGHHHHDVRFMIEADPDEPLVISSESKDLAWVGVSSVTTLNPEESMARMVRKTAALRAE